MNWTTRRMYLQATVQATSVTKIGKAINVQIIGKNYF